MTHQYTIDIFAKGNETEFPENTYFADDIDTIAKIISNCTRRVAGVKRVEVWIEETDDRDAIKTGEFLE